MCDFCRRWGFPCLWPEQGNSIGDDGAGSFEIVSRRELAIQYSLTGHGFSSFRDQEQLSLLRHFDNVYQSLICPLAGAEYADLSAFITVVLHDVWTRDALNVFTSFILFARSKDGHLERSALELYQSAVLNLREKVRHRLHKEEIMSVLVAATFLGLLEVSNDSYPILWFRSLTLLGSRYGQRLTCHSSFLARCAAWPEVFYRSFVEHITSPT